jgi:hypothetical protein
LSKRPAKSEKEETGKMDGHAEKMRNGAFKLPASLKARLESFLYVCRLETIETSTLQ